MLNDCNRRRLRMCRKSAWLIVCMPGGPPCRKRTTTRQLRTSIDIPGSLANLCSLFMVTESHDTSEVLKHCPAEFIHRVEPPSLLE
jgi:hypothetical protein